MADNNKELKKRLTNPNKEFDSLFWRPKSKFMRRLVAKYIDYITFLGYVLIALLVGGIIVTWTVDYRIWDDAKAEAKLMPRIETVHSPVAGVVDELLVAEGSEVSSGEAIARLTLTDGVPRTVNAPVNGYVFFGSGRNSDEVVRGTEIDSGGVLFRVADFSVFSIEGLKFDKGKGIDSISIGDSATVELVRNSGMERPTKVTGGLILHKPDGNAEGGAVTYSIPQAIMDSLAQNMQTVEVTAKKSGVFRFESISEVTLTVEATVDEGEGEAAFHASSAEMGGHVIDGYRWIEVEKIKGYPAAAREAVESWVRAHMHGALVDYEGTNLKIEEFKKLRMTTKIKARVPFKEFVPHKKRNGEMVEDLKKSDWLTVDIRLPDIPPHVQRQARLLYAQTPPEYLVGSVKVNSYITTWGKRLIAR